MIIILGKERAFYNKDRITNVRNFIPQASRQLKVDKRLVREESKVSAFNEEDDGQSPNNSKQEHSVSKVGEDPDDFFGTDFKEGEQNANNDSQRELMQSPLQTNEDVGKSVRFAPDTEFKVSRLDPANIGRSLYDL